MKLFDLAKNLGVKPLDLISIANKNGLKIKSHMSELSKNEEKKIISIQKKIKKDLEDEKLKRYKKAILSAKKCDHCQSLRLAEVSSQISNYTDFSFECEEDNIEIEGVPEKCNLNFEGNSEELHFRMCLACGKIQGNFPISKKNLFSQNKHEDWDFNDSDN